MTQKGITIVRSQMVTSKQPKFGLTQELFSRIRESTIGYTLTHCVGSFISPGIDIRQNGPPALVSLPKDTGTFGVYEIASVSKRDRWD